MTKSELTRSYQDYITCLNKRDWSSLGRFVHENAKHNGELLGLPGYRKMLEKDISEIPDLSFDVELLIVEPPYIASRLRFDCTPKEMFLNLSVLGQKISFAENVFYEFLDLKIVQVWSIIDKAAIEAQLLHH
ncbi:ester cyclase [Betaproteobacteria bacterium]|nr:ester cyclase [Betaproteobacteria bacterium]